VATFRENKGVHGSMEDVMPQLFLSQGNVEWTAEQFMFKNGVQNLFRGVGHRKRERYEQVLYNLELMGFTLSWMRVIPTSAVPFPLYSFALVFQTKFHLPDDSKSLSEAILK
jgi:hypothetical protein